MRTCALVAAVDFNEEHFRACDARGMFGTVIAVDAGLKHLDDIGREIFELMIRVSNGDLTKAESLGHREFGIYRVGDTCSLMFDPASVHVL